MPKRSERYTKKKFRKSVTGKSRKVSAKKKTSKKACPVTGEALHGVAHGSTTAKTRKLAKTKRRPSVKYGGMLSGGARTRIIEEAVKVRENIKSLNDVDFRIRKFVEQEIRELERQ